MLKTMGFGGIAIYKEFFFLKKKGKKIPHLKKNNEFWGNMMTVAVGVIWQSSN